MFVKELTPDLLEKAKEIAKKQSDSFFRSGVETGVELVISLFSKSIEDFENSEIKEALDMLLKHCQEQTKEVEAELEELTESLSEEKRVLN